MKEKQQVAEKKKPIDYASLGFMCGLEIHQQLEGKKLFCSCPAVISRDEPDFEVRRELRASAGETGEIDRAAAHEQAKKKHFIYQGYRDKTCLVELDEEPPHPINTDALHAALQVCAFLNAQTFEEIQVMRKIVVDGSNVSGFQRTALVGVNGWVEVEGKRISIPTVCLEEEACQVIERTREYDVYNLSRLGIPLIEIATGPEIDSPEMCRKVAAKIGMILRSTGKCKRGIGSIRQDVNISIRGGARTEIKGFQDLRSIPAVIENEVKRQLSLIKQGKKLSEEVRKAEPDFTTSYLRPMPGAARMYPETDIPPVRVTGFKIARTELIDEKIERLSKQHSISIDVMRVIVKKEFPFEEYVRRYRNVKPSLIADVFVKMPKEARKRFNAEISIEEHAPIVLEQLDKGLMPKDAVLEVLVNLSKGEKVDFASYLPASDDEIRKVAMGVVKKNPGAPIGALMGEAMKLLKGRAEGRRVMEILKETAGK